MSRELGSRRVLVLLHGVESLEESVGEGELLAAVVQQRRGRGRLRRPQEARREHHRQVVQTHAAQRLVAGDACTQLHTALDVDTRNNR